MSQLVFRRLAWIGLVLALAVPGGCASANGWGPAGASASSPRPAWFGDDEQAAIAVEGDGEVAAELEPESHGIGHRLLLWIPNRIFDVFDIARARVRLGPGIGFSVRATELIDVVLGAHTTFWVGLWGPRGEARIPWPVYLETFAGAGISLAEATTEDGLFSPHYGVAEFGAGFQAVLIGVDVGVDPLEIVDFLAGIFTFDLMDDDF